MERCHDVKDHPAIAGGEKRYSPSEPVSVPGGIGNWDAHRDALHSTLRELPDRGLLPDPGWRLPAGQYKATERSLTLRTDSRRRAHRRLRRQHRHHPVIRSGSRTRHQVGVGDVVSWCHCDSPSMLREPAVPLVPSGGYRQARAATVSRRLTAPVGKRSPERRRRAHGWQVLAGWCRPAGAGRCPSTASPSTLQRVGRAGGAALDSECFGQGDKARPRGIIRSEAAAMAQ